MPIFRWLKFSRMFTPYPKWFWIRLSSHGLIAREAVPLTQHLVMPVKLQVFLKLGWEGKNSSSQEEWEGVPMTVALVYVCSVPSRNSRLTWDSSPWHPHHCLMRQFKFCLFGRSFWGVKTELLKLRTAQVTGEAGVLWVGRSCLLPAQTFQCFLIAGITSL